MILFTPMKVLSFLLIFIGSISKAQTIRCKYAVLSDSSYNTYKSDDKILNFAITQLRFAFGIGAFLYCVADNNFLEVFPVNAFNNSLDTATLTFKPASTNRHKSLYSKKNKAVYTLDSSSIDCKTFLPFSFQKTKETKLIDRWYCAKWIPKDKAYQEKIEVWACDSISKNIDFGVVSNISGGIVSVKFDIGREWRLLNYSKAEHEFIVPECFTVKQYNYNLLKEIEDDKHDFHIKRVYEKR